MGAELKMSCSADNTEPGKGESKSGEHYAEIAVAEILSPSERDALYAEIAEIEAEDAIAEVEAVSEALTELNEEEFTLDFGQDEKDALDAALQDYIAEGVNESDDFEFAALSNFVTSGTIKTEWSGNKYFHPPGTFDISHAEKIQQLAGAVFGDKKISPSGIDRFEKPVPNYSLTIVDENPFDSRGEKKGVAGLVSSKSPYCRIELMLGTYNGQSGLQAVVVTLENRIAKSAISGVSDFIGRAARFLDDMLPFVLGFEDVRGRLRSGGLETDLLALAGGYGTLMRRYDQRCVEDGVMARMPHGNYSVSVMSVVPGSPLAVVFAGCDDVSKIDDHVTLGSEGLCTTVEKYADQEKRPRAFELYLL